VALLADAFILIDLTYIFYNDIATISNSGLEPTVKLFNPETFTLTIGPFLFTFEGIGLVLPIQSSMSRPDGFDFILNTVMTVITLLFTAVGALSYATFGSQTKTEIMRNFPQRDKLVNVVQFSYSLAILAGIPVQLFPAVQIMEAKLFGSKSGKRDVTIKWKKNAFRTSIVVLCVLLATVGARDLDKFVALVGSFACILDTYFYLSRLSCLSRCSISVSGLSKRLRLSVRILYISLGTTSILGSYRFRTLIIYCGDIPTADRS
jgi:proton-coupled amino acid transporter